MSGYCDFIKADCEFSNDSVRCGSVSAVACRTRRDKIQKEKEDAGNGRAVQEVLPE